MNIGIITRLSETLLAGNCDALMNLGDVVFGDLDTSLALVSALSVFNHELWAGNHDRFSAAYKSSCDKRDAAVKQYTDLLQLVALHSGNSRVKLMDGTEVQVSHYPFAGRDGLEQRHSHLIADKFGALRPIDDGGWLIHGHVHSMWRQNGRQINVGLDAWGGQPVSETQILELIRSGPNNLGPIPNWDSPSKTSPTT